MATRDVLWTIASATLTFGCGGDDPGDKVVGETAVVLDLVETGTRGRETPIGNLAADSVLELTASHGATIAMVNGGSLRCPAEFDAVQCQGYAIQPGPITQADLDIVLTFKTQLVVKDISGATLRSTLERSVATIPSELKGWFLHVSGLAYEADCSNPAQQIDAEGTTLISEGSRVTSITVGGAPLDDAATYRVGLNAFVAAGNDGHVLLGQAAVAESLSENEQDAAIAYLGAHSPVSPTVEGRIQLTADCLP